MRTAMALVVAASLLATAVGPMASAGAFDIEVELDPDYSFDEGRVRITHGDASLYFDFGIGNDSHLALRSFTKWPLGIVGDEPLFGNVFQDLTLERFIAFDDLDGDSAYDGEGEFVSSFPFDQFWEVSPPERIPSDGMDASWSFGISSDNVHVGNDTLRVTCRFDIGALGNGTEVDVPELDPPDVTLPAEGPRMLTVDVRQVLYRVTVHFDVEGWPAMEREGLTFALWLTFRTGERWPAGPDWMDWSNMSSMERTMALEIGPTVHRDRSEIEKTAPFNGSGIRLLGTGIKDRGKPLSPCVSALRWAANSSDTNISDPAGQIDMLRGAVEHNVSGVSYRGFHVKMLAIVRPDSGDVAFEITSYGPKDAPHLKLGFTFYLPVVFISVIFFATLAVVYRRRERQ